jgi:hypothetical protein
MAKRELRPAAAELAEADRTLPVTIVGSRPPELPHAAQATSAPMSTIRRGLPLSHRIRVEISKAPSSLKQNGDVTRFLACARIKTRLRSTTE